MRASLSEILEALGAVFIVAGLALWSLPWGLLAAGLFLVAVANAPGGRQVAAPPGLDDRRALELEELARRAREDEQERDAVLFHLELAALGAEDDQ